MLRETPAERGCFGGCLFSVFTGTILGVILGWMISGWYVTQIAQTTKDESLLLLRFMIIFISFLVGAVLGGGVGLIIAHKKAKDEVEEEVL